MADGVVFELRTYRIRKDCLEQWVRLMDTKIIPFQTAMGMAIVGSFTVRDMDDCYVWIRRFENEQERRTHYDRVYGSDIWKNDIRPAIDEMLIREETVVWLLDPTPLSPMR